MTPEQFVNGIKASCIESVTKGLLKSLDSPPGRKPSEDLIKLSNWYKELGDSDKLMVKNLIHKSAEFSVFGMLCLFDGARIIDGQQGGGELEVYFSKDNKKVRLNEPHIQELHGLL